MYRSLLLICAVGLALAACEPPPIDDDSINRYDPAENLMGEIQRDGLLRVGVLAGLPPWSSDDAGFTVDLGRMVADELGVDVTYVSAESDELIEMVRNGDVHLAFPMVPITEGLLEDNGLTDPYWVAHQRLLVPAGEPISGVDDLDGAAVCSLATEGVEVDIATLNPDVGEVIEADAAGCLEALQSGEVQAVTGPDILLLALKAQEPDSELVGDQLSTEGYGAVVGQGTGGFNGFVDAVLSEADREGRWADLYAKWVTPVSGDSPPDFPTMTLEEAAALFPLEG
jgi:ABC-type amino acid transport substrate-binding protein